MIFNISKGAEKTVAYRFVNPMPMRHLKVKQVKLFDFVRSGASSAPGHSPFCTMASLPPPTLIDEQQDQAGVRRHPHGLSTQGASPQGLPGSSDPTGSSLQNSAKAGKVEGGESNSKPSSFSLTSPTD